MIFNSYGFIFGFLLLFLLAYYTIGRKWGKFVLVAGSLIFYALGGWDSIHILAASLVVNELFALAITRLKKGGKWLLALSIAANVGLLLYFKYFNFLLSIVSPEGFTPRSLIQPLGISFFTFQQIMYLVSLYRKDIKDHRLFDYLAYILYFPKLLMGPLAEPKLLIPQLGNAQNHKVNSDNMAHGIRMFCFGLVKKVLIADTFAKAVAWGFTNVETATSMDLILVMLGYTFQIYFDFSGYSDMAVGVSTMLNISLPMNFNSPYKATSIRDFWKRWHMSLTSFFTKYVYFPLGGSRKGAVRTYVNTMIIFLVSGIWHGANWTFILWGALHGLLSVLERIFDKKDRKDAAPFGWVYTFIVTNILWLLFRSDSISQWLHMLARMCTFQSTAISDGLLETFILPETNFLLQLFHLQTINQAVRGLSLLVFFAAAFMIVLLPQNSHAKLLEKKPVSFLSAVAAAVVFVWSVLCLSGESVFLYFNF